MATAGTVSVEVEVKLNALDAGLARAESKTRETARRIDTATKGLDFFGGVNQQALRFAGGLAAVKGGFDLLTAGSEAFKGNWEAAADAARRFPILGPIADSMSRAYQSLTGMTEEMAKQEKFLARIAELEQKRDEFNRNLVTSLNEQSGRVQELGDQTLMEMFGRPSGFMTPEINELSKLTVERDQGITRATRAAADKGINPKPEIDAINSLFNARAETIRQRYKAEREQRKFEERQSAEAAQREMFTAYEQAGQANADPSVWRDRNNPWRKLEMDREKQLRVRSKLDMFFGFENEQNQLTDIFSSKRRDPAISAMEMVRSRTADFGGTLDGAGAQKIADRQDKTNDHLAAAVKELKTIARKEGPLFA